MKPIRDAEEDSFWGGLVRGVRFIRRSLMLWVGALLLLIWLWPVPLAQDSKYLLCLTAFSLMGNAYLLWMLWRKRAATVVLRGSRLTGERP